MRAAHFVLPLAALLLISCASGNGAKRCTDFSGLYTSGSCHQHEKKPLKEILLPDSTALAGVSTITITQSGCNEVRISSKDRADIVLHPDEDSAVRWTEDGRLMGGTKPVNSVQILPGFARSSRAWYLSVSDSGNGLVYTDERDERGMALLLIPFHEHLEAECEWVRMVAAK
jgi:hypothetical protein